ncbi:hypothetical protein CR970_02375 [Candidatus Saccharibacteria bacterium]|nr:MAG: hypothetical protein CR970_02375 [Candidatus Saccharibacteria bacterium]
MGARYAKTLNSYGVLFVMEANDDVLQYGFTLVSNGLTASADAVPTGQWPKAGGVFSNDGDGHLLAPVDKTLDSGCMDGRPCCGRRVLRAKVAGGDVCAVAAAMIGMGQAGPTSNATFEQAIDLLEQYEINYGGHRDEAHEKDPVLAGCGAIDKMPKALQAIVDNAQAISRLANALCPDSEALVAQAIDNFTKQVADASFTAEHNGRVVVDTEERSGKRVPVLGGGHAEAHILVNTIQGYTVDQSAAEQKLDGRQVFVVDAWRMDEVCERLYGAGTQQAAEAYVSMVVYVLAVAAVLAPQLPVWLISGSAVRHSSEDAAGVLQAAA